MDKRVQDQYNNWVYPVIFNDIESAINNGYYEIGDPQYYWHLFWPHKKRFEKLDVLIAGCGTNQAAYYAFSHPNWNVIGIDISDSSLNNQKMLKEKHGLDNLTLHNLDLEHAYKLNKDFDFITSTGVLHHLPNPKLGLDGLKGVLKNDGVMNLMLHGESLRMGIYLIKEIFQTLKVPQNKEGIDFVRTVIESLSDDHILKRYTNLAIDLHNDAHVVDTFLHPIDRGYFAKDIFSFLRDSELEFLNWCDPTEYSPHYIIGENHEMFNKLKGLSEEETSQICDLIALNRGTHRFFAAHPDFVKLNKFDINKIDILKYAVVPHKDLKKILTLNTELKNQTTFELGGVFYQIDNRVVDVLLKADEFITLESIIKNINFNNSYGEDFKEFVRKEIRWMYDRNILFLTNP
jgi:SAM-dependent methyltransferase